MKNLVLFVAACGVLTFPAKAAIITNIDLQGKAYTGAAVVGSSTDDWNLIPTDVGPTTTSLFGTDGSTSTGLTIKNTAFFDPYIAGSPLWPNSPTPGITYGIDTTNTNTVWDLTGFDSTKLYTFDFLTATNTTGRETGISLTGLVTSTGTATMDTDDKSWNPGAEYIQFTDVAPDAKGDFSFTLSAPNDSAEGDLNGLQILSGGAAPEPGAFALLGLGLGLLGLTIRPRGFSGAILR